jgi:hypothetical protein
LEEVFLPELLLKLRENPLSWAIFKVVAVFFKILNIALYKQVSHYMRRDNR